jgi:GH25 family lysozyme M1 (1,4-beta-N-acetylmuramidase)
LTFKPPANPPLPIDFVIQRLSYAAREDELVAKINTGVQQVGIRGAYHYFSSGVDWRSQADLFIGIAETYGPFHFFALDVETSYNKRSAGFALDAKQWIDYVAQKTGKKVVLYTNPSTYRNWLLPYTRWMNSYPLWVAQYYYFPSHTKNPSLSGMDRTEWNIYQYTSRGSGSSYGVGSTSVDLNTYNGTVGEFKIWLGLEDDDEIPPPTTSGIPKAKVKKLLDDMQAVIDANQNLLND